MNQDDLPVPINNDLERKIADAFLIFDHAGNKTVDAREIPTIVRSLGCCPTEAEIQEIIVANEDQECPGNVHLSDFLPYMVQVITERKFQPASAEKLLEAFKVLDVEGKKFLTKEEITTLMTESGEPLQPDELEEMLQVALNSETDTVPYEVYINEIMFHRCELFCDQNEKDKMIIKVETFLLNIFQKQHFG